MEEVFAFWSGLKSEQHKCVSLPNLFINSTHSALFQEGEHYLSLDLTCYNTGKYHCIRFGLSLQHQICVRNIFRPLAWMMRTAPGEFDLCCWCGLLHFPLLVIRGHCSLAEPPSSSGGGSLFLTSCTAPKQQELFDLQACPMTHERLQEDEDATKCKQASESVPPRAILTLRNIQTQQTAPLASQKPALRRQILHV